MNIMQHVLQVTKGLALLTGVLGVSALVGTPAMADTSTAERNLAQAEFPSDSSTITTPATTTPTTIDVQVPVETAPAQTDTNVVVPVEVPSTTDSSTTDDSSTIPSTSETVPSRIEVTPRVNPPVDSSIDTPTSTPTEGQIQVVPSPAQTDVVVPIDTPTDTTGSDVTPVTPTTPTDLDGAQLPVREFQVSQSSEGMTDPTMPSMEETPSSDSEDLGYPATETPLPENPGYEVETPGYEESPMMEMPGEEANEADMLPETDAEESAASGNIVETAVSSGSFDTLVQAIEAAGLSETLTGEGPYTVFAPTDEAFAALPPGVLDALLLPENQGLLARILTYHVASGELTSDQIATGAVETVDGGAIAVRVTDDNQVIVNDGSVIQADIVASNGIIHAINRVLLPPDIQEQLSAFPK